MHINKIKNTQGIKSIKIKSKANCFCPIGKVWYTIKLIIYIKPGNYYPDYCDIRTFINNEINNKNLIIEDVINNIYQFMRKYKPLKIKVTGKVDKIESHPPVEVSKY
jgi:dihydroorotate dehydrogenase